jgi:ABC-type uncharacterized transport system substrate-binding protein
LSRASSWWLLGWLWSAEALAGPRVVVVVSDELEAYRIPTEAFLSELDQQPRVYNLHGRPAEADSVVDQLKGNPPEVAFCVGAKAAYAIKNGLPDTKVVYAAILDPERYGIAGEQVTGVNMGIEPVTYLSQFSGFFPEVRNIGVIPGPDTSAQRLLAMEAAAVELDKKLIVRRVNSTREVRRAFLELTRQGIDALWIPPERTVLTTSAYRALTEEVRRRHLPLLVETASMVEAGGLFTMVPDPEGMGQQAARLVNRLLDGEEPPRPEDPERLLVVLNTRTLEGAELEFDPLLLDFVDRLVD